jgi:hypothetical protein
LVNMRDVLRQLGLRRWAKMTSQPVGCDLLARLA